MTRMRWINRVLLTVLSISTGLVKVVRMEEEMLIFRSAGFTDQLTVAFGVIQLAGGLLLIAGRTTRIGAWIMAPTFVIATGVLFLNGMTTFGIVSVFFIAMALFHARTWEPDLDAAPQRGT